MLVDPRQETNILPPAPIVVNGEGLRGAVSDFLVRTGTFQNYGLKPPPVVCFRDGQPVLHGARPEHPSDKELDGYIHNPFGDAARGLAGMGGIVGVAAHPETLQRFANESRLPISPVGLEAVALKTGVFDFFFAVIGSNLFETGSGNNGNGHK